MTTAIARRRAAIIKARGKDITYRRMASILGSANPPRNPVTGAVTVQAATSAGSAYVTLTAPAGRWYLEAGDAFTLPGDAAVYTVQARVISTSTATAAGLFSGVNISPPLASAAAAGATCSFIWGADYPVRAIIGDYEAEMINGTTIQAVDLRLKMSRLAIDGREIALPTTLDALIIDGQTRSIVTAKPKYSGGTLAYFEIQAR